MSESDDNDLNSRETVISKQEIQRMEYQECASLNRFVTGVRYSFLATHSTFFVVILAGYRYVWSQQDIFGSVQTILLFLISLFGFCVSFLALMVETNNVRVLTKCQIRLVKLENQLGISKGIYSQLTQEARQHRLLPGMQTTAVYIANWLMIIVWLALLIYGGYQLIS